MDRHIREAMQEFGYREMDLGFGAVIGIVSLDWIRPMDEKFIGEQSLMELAAGNWEPGRYAWKMTVLEKFVEPIPARGHQQLFDWAFEPEPYENEDDYDSDDWEQL